MQRRPAANLSVGWIAHGHDSSSLRCLGVTPWLLLAPTTIPQHIISAKSTKVLFQLIDYHDVFTMETFHGRHRC